MYKYKIEDLKKFVISSEEYNQALDKLKTEKPDIARSVDTRRASEEDICSYIDGMYILCERKEDYEPELIIFSFNFNNLNLIDTFLTEGLLLLKLYNIKHFEAFVYSGRYDKIFMEAGIVARKFESPRNNLDRYLIDVEATAHNLFKEDYEGKMAE